jgi:hypothetical protein
MKRKILPIIASMLFLFNACDDPSVTGPGPLKEELITHVVVEFVDSANTVDTMRAEFIDMDGPAGSGAPTITGATLKLGRTYLASVKLYEVIRSSTADSLKEITDDIRDEGDHHQFFYTLSGPDASMSAIEITDEDANGLPLGLTFTMRNQAGSAAGQSVLNVVLSHFEDDGQKNGTARGESDVDIDFPIAFVP